jgi:hypothetical protein
VSTSWARIWVDVALNSGPIDNDDDDGSSYGAMGWMGRVWMR